MNEFPYKFAFQWRRPTVDWLRAADRHWGFVLNRYPGCVIGIAFFLGRRGVGFRWGRPGAVVYPTDKQLAAALRDLSGGGTGTEGDAP